jgi:hypothetical protein
VNHWFERAYHEGQVSTETDSVLDYNLDDYQRALYEAVEERHMPLAGYYAGRLTGYGNAEVTLDEGVTLSY